MASDRRSAGGRDHNRPNRWECTDRYAQGGLLGAARGLALDEQWVYWVTSPTEETAELQRVAKWGQRARQHEDAGNQDMTSVESADVIVIGSGLAVRMPPGHRSTKMRPRRRRWGW